MWKSFRISKDDRERLEEMAEQRGMTTSDLMRDMIRHGYQHQGLFTLLDGVRKQHSREIDQLREEIRSFQKGGVGGSQDLMDIKRVLSAIDKRTSEQNRIITLLGQASPFVSRQLGQQ